MPATPPKRPRQTAQLVEHQTNSPESANRMIDAISTSMALDPQQTRSHVSVDLTVGDNRINHALGTKPAGCHLTPTVADATFAWALKSVDDRQAVITIVGVAQPNASLEFYA